MSSSHVACHQHKENTIIIKCVYIYIYVGDTPLNSRLRVWQPAGANYIQNAAICHLKKKRHNALNCAFDIRFGAGFPEVHSTCVYIYIYIYPPVDGDPHQPRHILLDFCAQEQRRTNNGATRAVSIP